MLFNRFVGLVFIVLSVVCLSAFAAGAVTYTYAGNNFTTIADDASTPAGTYDVSMSVSGSFTVATALAPNLDANIAANLTSVSFSDGRNVLNDLSDIVVLGVETDGSGAITGWNIVLQRIEGYSVGDQHVTIETRSVPTLNRDLGRLFECTSEVTPIRCFGGQDRGEVLNNPGSWSVVPEPGTALLVGIGLVGLTGLRKP